MNEQPELLIEEYSMHKIHTLYLSWFNDFLTVERFSEYYELSLTEASAIIETGRKWNELTRPLTANNESDRRLLDWESVLED